MLTVKEIKQSFNDFEKLNVLNTEAFPVEERIATETLLKWSESRDFVKLLAFYNKDTFVGFAYLMVNPQLIYLGFLAVTSERRGLGYGSQILTLIQGRYAGRPMVLEIERLDEPCANLEQRQARWAFYERNGFAMSDYVLNYDGLSFAILYTGNSFPLSDYDHMFRMVNPNFHYEILLRDQDMV